MEPTITAEEVKRDLLQWKTGLHRWFILEKPLDSLETKSLHDFYISCNNGRFLAHLLECAFYGDYIKLLQAHISDPHEPNMNTWSIFLEFNSDHVLRSKIDTEEDSFGLSKKIKRHVPRLTLYDVWNKDERKSIPTKITY